MALLSTTLIIMFGMVVSIGHLIQAKMNLQNAVDLAAMSGASWQARYLNHLALINYRMRQNYKFILYDLYVTQSRFNQGLKDQLNNISGSFDRVPDLRAGSQQLVFGICQQAFGYDPASQVGEPGRAIAADTDMCQRVRGTGRRGETIPPIVPSPIPNLNPAVIAANLAIAELSRQASEVCNNSGGQNQWYFRYIMKHLEDRQRFQMEQLVELTDLFKQAFNIQNPDLERNSRHSADATIFRTFEENLISANRSGAVQLQWLNPPESRTIAVPQSREEMLNAITAANDLPSDMNAYFERMLVRFQIPFVEFKSSGGLGGVGASCEITVKLDNFGGTSQSGAVLPEGPGILLGLTRKRFEQSPYNVQRPLMVALRATVKPRLLFWPQGLTPTLVAVGGAKPFGSRLAPPSFLSNLEVFGLPTWGESRASALANMSFYPGDYYDPQSGRMPGMGHKRVIDALLDLMPNSRGGYRLERPSLERPGRSSNSSCRDSTSFLCMALFPTFYEGFFWNTFPFPDEYADPALRPFFPSDHSNITRELSAQRANTARNLYFMPDRMRTEISGQQLLLWHQTALFNPQAASSFRDLVSNNRPVFFASSQSALSSWSPDIRPSSLSPGSSPLTTTVTGAADLRGRMGYQIKLVSMEQVCAELKSAQLPLQGSLSGYCEGSGEERLFQ
jgi:hypothetical protein